MRSSSGPSWRSLWLATMIFASGCASVFDTDGALAVVPYTVNDTGRIMITANINESGPFDFAIDTGASISMLLEETVERSGLEQAGSKPVLIHGMMGAGRYPTAKIDTLAVGSETLSDVRVAIMPGDTPASRGLDGLLGVDILSRYALGYSFADRVIRLYPPDLVAERAYSGWSSVPLQRLSTVAGDSTLYAIDIQISGRTIPALLDLGSSANLMNTRALRHIGERIRRRREGTELAGAVEAITVHLELIVSNVYTANLRWRNKSFLVADVRILDVLQLDGRPIAIIGTDFFDQRDFVIDFARNRLLVRHSD